LQQVLRDGVGRHFDRFGADMGVARCGLDLRVAKELADHWQSLTRRHGSGREGVTQVVNANVGQCGVFLDLGSEAPDFPNGLADSFDGCRRSDS
jgi:hypothetical protein